MTATDNTSLDITITANGTDYSGWFDATVERSIEQLAGKFTLKVNTDEAIDIKHQDEVQVSIASVPVIGGYCLKADPYYKREDIGRIVTGRDRCGDLAVASAIYEGGQWLDTALQQIATDLCAPFGVTVRVDDDVLDDIAEPFERFEIEAGETVANCLARICSYRGVLAIRDNSVDNQGGVYIGRAGKEKAPAAIRAGVNVISMEPLGSDDQRFSEYQVRGQDEFNLYDFSGDAAGVEAVAKDPHLKRYLPLVQNADSGGDHIQMQQRAEHLARVRYGHAFAYKYILDCWSVNGVPWSPNTRVPVYDPMLGLNGEEWLIVSTLQRVDREEADVCEVVIKPIAAFDAIAIPEPEVLV